MHTAALSAAVRRLSREDERRSGFVVGLQALQRLLVGRSRRDAQMGGSRPSAVIKVRCGCLQGQGNVSAPPDHR